MVLAPSRGNGAVEISRYEFHIRNLCKHGHMAQAFGIVDDMETRHVPLSRDIIYSLLQSCHRIKNLAFARRIHALMQKHKLSSIAALGDHLIRLFTACRSLHEANEAFFDISNPSVFTWNSIISAHAKLGDGLKAFQLFEKMQLANVVPDRVTFVCVSSACAHLEALRPGMYMHHKAIQGGFESNIVLRNALIAMYASCGCLNEASRLFNMHVEKDIITWTNIISGYATQGQGLPALRLYSKLYPDLLKPNVAIFLSAIKACTYEGAISDGQLIHGEIVEDGMESEAVITSSLAAMYSKCGYLEDAGKVFGALSCPDVISWSAMIDGYAQSAYSQAALHAFQEMLESSVEPNEATFLGVMKACNSLDSTVCLKCIYSHIIEEGLETNIVIGSALVDTFANFESLEDAYFVFTKLGNKNEATWGAVISGFLDCGQASNALQLFSELLLEGSEPNIIVCLCALKACSNVEHIEQGLIVHLLIVQKGFEADKAIGNTLVDFYAKKGDLDSALFVFCGLSSPDAVSFGALITGYSRHGQNALALDLHHSMQKKGILPDRATFLGLLKACGSAGAVGQGHLLHEQIVLNGVDSALFVKNALVDMYTKNKKLDDARQILANRANHDVVSYSSVIGGLKHCSDLECLGQFVKDILHEGCEPDNSMLASILTACSSGGLLNEGYDLFTSIVESQSLAPTQDHYSSTVDLLGRAGHLLLAEDVSLTMPMPPDTTTTMSLFANAKTYNVME